VIDTRYPKLAISVHAISTEDLPATTRSGSSFRNKAHDHDHLTRVHAGSEHTRVIVRLLSRLRASHESPLRPDPPSRPPVAVTSHEEPLSRFTAPPPFHSSLNLLIIAATARVVTYGCFYERGTIRRRARARARARATATPRSPRVMRLPK